MHASSGRRGLVWLSVLALAGTLGGLAWAVWRLADEVSGLEVRSKAAETTLQEVLGEVNRIRIEQRADKLGPAGLLEKLRAYAPLAANARVPEPDYQAAKKELDAILRAFATIGEDAWGPVTARLREVNGETDYDEARWLLRAAVRIDEKAGKEIVKDVLAGTRLPSPRLRLEAAGIMIEIDKPLAQNMLRHIMTTESSRGVNLQRVGSADVPIPDQAALSATGFNNYVQRYLQSEDEQIDETLLQVIGRAEHDLITVQDCVKALGQRRYERAVPAIEKLYREPPNRQENPMFLAYCLTALHEIQGPKARPFLEEALRNATNEALINHCKRLLGGGG